jgi:hypothetical protein
MKKSAKADFFVFPAEEEIGRSMPACMRSEAKLAAGNRPGRAIEETGISPFFSVFRLPFSNFPLYRQLSIFLLRLWIKGVLGLTRLPAGH